MSEPTEPGAAGATQISVPPLCDPHQSNLIRWRLRMTESDPWQMAVLTCSMLVWRRAINTPTVWKRAGGEADALSVVLAEIGCLACYDWQAYEDAVDVIRSHGWRFGFDVVMGREVHSLFPIDPGPA